MTASTSWPQYVYRVYVPRFLKPEHTASYSTYSPDDELKIQVRFCIVLGLFLVTFGYHAWSLMHCYSHRKANVCYMNQYSWQMYSGMLALVVLLGMQLHYGFAETSKTAADYQVDDAEAEAKKAIDEHDQDEMGSDYDF